MRIQLPLSPTDDKRWQINAKSGVLLEVYILVIVECISIRHMLDAVVEVVQSEHSADLCCRIRRNQIELEVSITILREESNDK